MVFCNPLFKYNKIYFARVTILILIDGFLQWNLGGYSRDFDISHNPYFNRWFSAILKNFKPYWAKECHNPYFNRWFSAIFSLHWTVWQRSHNPYFNRWFSAIQDFNLKSDEDIGHNPYFNRWFSAIVLTQ